MEIKHSCPGRMALNPFIESHRMCKVFPLSNDFLIKNGHITVKDKGNRQESSKAIENKARLTHGDFFLSHFCLAICEIAHWLQRQGSR